jgi:hypothetical protein
MMPSTATSLKAAAVELMISAPIRMASGKWFDPTIAARTMLNARDIKIQARLFRKLSIKYPITGLTSQAKVIKLEMNMIFSGENFRDSLR